MSMVPILMCSPLHRGGLFTADFVFALLNITKYVDRIRPLIHAWRFAVIHQVCEQRDFTEAYCGKRNETALGTLMKR